MAFKYAPKDPSIAAFTASNPTVAKRLQPPGQPKVTIPPPTVAPPAPPPTTPDPDFAEVPGHPADALPYMRLPLKKAIKLRIDEDIIAKFRATGPGWQTRMNHALRVAAARL
jgi:hypothetical protein